MNIDEISKLDPASFDEICSVLPASALEFVRLIGIEATLALISCFGGAEVRFAKAESSWKFERISQVTGRQAALKLAATFSSDEDVYIPNCTRARRMLRDRKIIREYDLLTTKNGVSCREAANELAIKFGVSNRLIEIVVNAPA